MAKGFRGIIPVTGQVLEALREKFVDTEHAPLGGVVDRVEHRPGMDIALDNLSTGECSAIVWANVQRIFPCVEFPDESPGQGCGMTAATIQVGAARCVSVVSEYGAPTPDEMEHEALVGLDDAYRLDRAAGESMLACEERGLITQHEKTGLEPVGPQGGVLAWVMQLTVQLG